MTESQGRQGQSLLRCGTVSLACVAPAILAIEACSIPLRHQTAALEPIFHFAT